jgi:hypothetical protein
MAVKQPWWRYVDWWLFLPVLALGGALHYLYPASWAVSELVRGGLSDAMMIAALLGMTVDRRAKDKLLSEVSADIWAHLMGRNLPVAVKGFIQGALDTTMVATRCEFRYRFERRSDSSLDVHVEGLRRYENFGSGKATLEPFWSIFESERPTFESYQCEQDGRPPLYWPGDSSAAKIETHKGTVEIRGQTVVLRPHGKNGNAADVTVKWKLVRRADDTDIQAFEIPTTGVTIIQESGGSDGIGFEVDNATKAVGYTWKLDEPVLWSRGYVRVRWVDEQKSTRRPGVE